MIKLIIYISSGEKFDLLKMAKMSIFVREISLSSIYERYFFKSCQKAIEWKLSVTTCSIVSPTQSQKKHQLFTLGEKTTNIVFYRKVPTYNLKRNSLILFRMIYS